MNLHLKKIFAFAFLCIYIKLFITGQNITHLTYINSQDQDSISVFTDPVNLFLLNQKISKNTLDSICFQQKKSDSLKVIKFTEFRNGVLSSDEYMFFLLSMQPSLQLNLFSVWCTGYDTIRLNDTIFEIYKFDVSCGGDYNQDFCYRFTYVYNQFITILSGPSEVTTNEKHLPFYKYYLISVSPQFNLGPLNNLIVKSDQILDGETWLNRKINEIVSEK